MLPDGCHWAFEDQKTALKRKFSNFTVDVLKIVAAVLTVGLSESLYIYDFKNSYSLGTIGLIVTICFGGFHIVDG